MCDAARASRPPRPFCNDAQGGRPAAGRHAAGSRPDGLHGRGLGQSHQSVSGALALALITLAAPPHPFSRSSPGSSVAVSHLWRLPGLHRRLWRHRQRQRIACAFVRPSRRQFLLESRSPVLFQVSGHCFLRQGLAPAQPRAQVPWTYAQSGFSNGPSGMWRDELLVESMVFVLS